ncbi:hypothetical protein [Tautonia sociabilis]|uniref:Uncharacterized protein n=1 Tax=Tautonia sociabilis TaxID=2080755 RepID=A0A432MFC6_9BACT|nr:hypothetical protein [Tautonia sociabilis]RUL84583.1 hypothetical protein TsocGM_20115 [Tautonia sociabilis]
MRRFCIAAVLLALAGPGIARGDSVWETLVNTSRELKERYSDKVYIWNETNRITRFKVRRGDGTLIGITGPVFPGQFSPRITDLTLPNPKVYEIKAFVWNDRNQTWVAKTGWVRFRNPDPGEPYPPENWGDNLYFVFYRTGDGFALDWL